MRTVSEPKDGLVNGLESGCSPESSESSAAGRVSDGEPGDGGGDGGGFGVSVCLRRVLGAADPRARCLVWVEPERRVRCLLRRLRRLCGPLGPGPARAAELCLLVRGHWLPPDEPLALLRPGDQLQLVPVEESQLGEETGESEAVRGAGGRSAPGRARGPGEAGAGAGEGAAELERGKKRALGLLDQYEAGAVEGGPPPPARRRRRHRRPGAGARREPAPAPSPPASPAPDEARAPRVVRAMPLPPPPPPLAAAPATPGVAESTEALE